MIAAFTGNRLMQLGPEDAQEFYRSFLVWYASFAKPRYLEIGCAGGDTCWRMYEHCQYIDAVDTVYNSSWDEHKSKFPNLHYFYGTSDMFFARWLGQHEPTIDDINPYLYDLVFIDGDHDAGQVLRDVHNSLKLLAPEGMIVLHDTHPPTQAHADPQWCGTAYKALEQLQAESLALGIQVYTFPVTYGLTLITRKLVLPWA